MHADSSQKFQTTKCIMVLRTEEISYGPGDQPVLAEISLEVKKGEILGIFGIDTVATDVLMRILNGFEQPDAGRMFFDGGEIADQSDRRRMFSIFPDPVDHGTGPSPPKRAGDRKSALAGKLVGADNILLLNNPFCCFDLKSRDEMLGQIRMTAHDKNLPVILATNKYKEIFAICDRAAVLQNGRIIQTGTPRQIYENPETSASAGITGRNNLFEARPVSASNRETPEFQTVEGSHLLFTDINQGSDQPLSVDQTVTLAIRPEHISISSGASFPEDNLLKAKITGIDYMGATTLINLDASGLALKALVLRLVGLQIGDECVVGLPPDRILVLTE